MLGEEMRIPSDQFEGRTSKKQKRTNTMSNLVDVDLTFTKAELYKAFPGTDDEWTAINTQQSIGIIALLKQGGNRQVAV